MSYFHLLVIKEIKNETSEAVSIVFDIPEELKAEFNFVAGQYITLKKEIDGEEIRRAYSICSAPGSGEVRIAVKAVKNGTFSIFATSKLQVGDSIEVSPPEGKFLLQTAPDNQINYLGIAAGSGITPVMSIIKATIFEEPKSTFTLIYGNKSLKDTIFKSKLDTLQAKYPNRLKLYYVFSREHIEEAFFGRIDKGITNNILKNECGKTIFQKAFLCGPEDMIHTAQNTLTAYGMNESAISFELFATPVQELPQTNSYEGFSEVTVLLDDEETSFKMEAKTSILTAALKNGIDAPYSCQGGICSSCMAKLTEGSVVMDKNIILTDDEVKEGFILTCQAHPTSQSIGIDYDDV